ncbi:hypothetical protein ES702_07480 [subsurface metagenome]
MANRNKKIAPKDVILEEQEEYLQPTPIPQYPRPLYRKRNRGEERAAEEEKKRRKPEYPGARNVTER